MFAQALAQVSPHVMRGRMTAVIGVDASSGLSSLSVPVMYLRASQDRGVPASVSEAILAKVPQMKVVELVAPHFLLQAAPKEAAAAVNAFVSQVEHATERCA